MKKKSEVVERTIRFEDLKEEVQKELFKLFGVDKRDYDKLQDWRLAVLSKEMKEEQK